MRRRFVLYAGSIAWVIGYDTIYAHQDREDDAADRHQIDRAAVRRAAPGRCWRCSMPAAVVLIGVAGLMAGGGLMFAARACSPSPRIWPGRSCALDIDDPAHCLRLFKSNRDAGLILFGAMLLEARF